MAHDLCCVVGHMRPSFKLWPGFRYVNFSAQTPDDLVIPQDPALASVHNSLTGEYYFLFGLRRYLLNLAPEQLPQRVVVAQYRRFLITQPLGTPSANVAGTNTLTSAAVEALPTALFLPAAGEWLVGQPIRFQVGMMQQFHHAHSLRDLLRFVCAATDVQALTNEQANAMLAHPLLIPAVTVGVLPTSVFLHVMEVLERVALSYMKEGYIARVGYQARVAGFCLERLHSYLLLEEIVKQGLQNSPIWGHRTVASENNTISQTI